MQTDSIQVPPNFGHIGSLSLNRKISELKPPTPICLELETSVAKAINILQEHHIGCALVADNDGNLCGILTERDIVQKWINSGLPEDDTPVCEIMTENPQCLSPDSTIAAALYIMSKGGFRHLPLVDQSSKACGIISSKDVMDFIAMEFMRSMFTHKE